MQRRKAEQVNGRAGQDAPPTVYRVSGERGKMPRLRCIVSVESGARCPAYGVSCRWRAGQDAPPTVYGAGGGRGKTEPYTQKHEQCEKCKNNFANVILSLPFFYPSALPPFHSSPLTASV